MDNLHYLIGYVEERHNAVCDAFQDYENAVVMELRTVRETFEYACLVTINRETRFIEEYEFLWSWYKSPPKKFQIEPKPPVLAMTDVDTVPFNFHSTPVQRSVSQSPQIPQNKPKTVRRKATEFA